MAIEPTWKALYGGGWDCPDGEPHRPVKRTGNTASCSRCDAVLVVDEQVWRRDGVVHQLAEWGFLELERRYPGMSLGHSVGVFRWLKSRVSDDSEGGLWES